MTTPASPEQLKRLAALKAKHGAVSERLETAMKKPATADYYLKQLKKQKLMLKDSIQRLVGSHHAANQTEAAG